MPCYKCGKDKDASELNLGYSLQKLNCSCGCERLCHYVCAGYPTELYFTEKHVTEMKWWCDESVFASNFKKLPVPEINEQLKLTNITEQAKENLEKNKMVDKNIQTNKNLILGVKAFNDELLKNLCGKVDELNVSVQQAVSKLVANGNKLNVIVECSEEMLETIDYVKGKMKKYYK